MPETILAIPFNRKTIESMKTKVRKPNAGDIKTTKDKMIVNKPTPRSKPRSQLGKTLLNPPITTLAIPIISRAVESMKISVKIASSGYARTTIDNTIAIRPKMMPKIRNQPGAFLSLMLNP